MEVSKEMFQDCNVLILSGGLGSRLREVVSDRPKTMADINGKPFLDIIIDFISSYGLKRIIICTGYLSEYIEEYYKKYDKSLEIIISKEEKPLGTGGAIKNAEKYIQSDNFFVMNGDSYCPLNLKSFYEFHLLKKSSFSIALVRPDGRDDCGNVIIGKNEAMESFAEKEGKDGLVNAGIYLMSKRNLSYIPEKVKYSLENDFLSKKIVEDIFCFSTDEKLLDIGVKDRYNFAKQIFNRA